MQAAVCRNCVNTGIGMFKEYCACKAGRALLQAKSDARPIPIIENDLPWCAAILPCPNCNAKRSALVKFFIGEVKLHECGCHPLIPKREIKL